MFALGTFPGDDKGCRLSIVGMLRIEFGPSVEPVVAGMEGSDIGHFREPAVEQGVVEGGCREQGASLGGHESVEQQRAEVFDVAVAALGEEVGRGERALAVVEDVGLAVFGEERVFIDFVAVGSHHVHVGKPDVVEGHVAVFCVALRIAFLVVENQADGESDGNGVEAVQARVATQVHGSLELAEGRAVVGEEVAAVDVVGVVLERGIRLGADEGDV